MKKIFIFHLLPRAHNSNNFFKTRVSGLPMGIDMLQQLFKLFFVTVVNV